MSSTTNTIARRAAVAQLRSTSDKLSNLVEVARCAGWARQEGASMLFLPECFGFIGSSSKETLEQAEAPLDGSLSKNSEFVTNTLKATVKSARQNDQVQDNEKSSSDGKVDSLLDGLKAIAIESNLWISGGGMHILTNDEKRVYNTHVIIDNNGSLVCFYRKIHLFDVSIPNKVNLRESATTAPGTELVVCDSPIGRLGLSTCYDVRFPEMYTDLVRQGAQILLVPSAFTVPTGSAHWHILLRARAIETQTYVIAAAQYGRHNEKRTSYGHSLAVDPWGKILADAGGCDGPGTMEKQLDDSCIVTCDIDLDQIESIRQRIPIQQHRDNCSYEPIKKSD